MPIVIPKDIPAFSVLQSERIFVMNEERAQAQDIRPIEIAIVNLMPTKIVTETQLMRLLSNSPLQINITLLATESYQGKNTSPDHLERFYSSFSEVKNKRFDGMIITGAPVEKIEFDEVKYWQELKEIFDFAEKMVTSTVFICWGAQAALYHYYGINKYPLKKKLFGVYPQWREKQEPEPLLKGLDDIFQLCHSRYTTVSREEIEACDKLEILAGGDKTGVSIVKSTDNKFFFITGHAEYDRDTLKLEYLRDKEKGLDTLPPENYFINGDENKINFSWASTANLIYINWLNYYVYQVTPFKN